MSADLLDGATLVTGNPNKLVETRRLCGHDLAAAAVDLPEIQSLDLAEVLEAKADEAYRRLARPVIVEETGLELAAMNGFPGPLVKWMLEAVGTAGVARAALAMGDGAARAHCMLLFYDGRHRQTAEGATTGTLVLPPRGDAGFGWDPVFQPDGEERTYGEMTAAEKDRIGHRGRAWRALLELLHPSAGDQAAGSS
ncbi:MAG: non-canonical purine NTP pyrophosphatase [Thermoanaerobaculia bacterium]